MSQFDKSLRTYTANKDIKLLTPLVVSAQRHEKKLFFIAQGEKHAFLCFPKFNTETHLGYSPEIDINCYIIGECCGGLGGYRVYIDAGSADKIINHLTVDDTDIRIYSVIRLNSLFVHPTQVLSEIRKSFNFYLFVGGGHYEEIVAPDNFVETLEESMN